MIDDVNVVGWGLCPGATVEVANSARPNIVCEVSVPGDHAAAFMELRKFYRAALDRLNNASMLLEQHLGQPCGLFVYALGGLVAPVCYVCNHWPVQGRVEKVTVYYDPFTGIEKDDYLWYYWYPSSRTKMGVVVALDEDCPITARQLANFVQHIPVEFPKPLEVDGVYYVSVQDEYVGRKFKNRQDVFYATIL